MEIEVIEKDAINDPVITSGDIIELRVDPEEKLYYMFTTLGEFINLSTGTRLFANTKFGIPTRESEVETLEDCKIYGVYDGLKAKAVLTLVRKE